MMERLPEDPSLDPPYEDEEEGMLADLIQEAEETSSEIDDCMHEIAYKMEEALYEALESKKQIEELLQATRDRLRELDKSIERNRQ